MTTFFQKYVNCMGRGIPLSNDNKISRTSAILPCSAGFYFESRFLFWKLVMKCKSVFTVLGHLFSKWNPMNSIFQWYGSDPKDLCFWWSIFFSKQPILWQLGKCVFPAFMATIAGQIRSFITIMQFINPNYCVPEILESNR